MRFMRIVKFNQKYRIDFIVQYNSQSGVKVGIDSIFRIFFMMQLPTILYI